jgi:DNA-binding SARP family transcriptional activator
MVTSESPPRPRAAAPVFRLLGPLEVAAGAVRIEAPRQRIVLAVLALEANRVIPVDRLVDAVWDQSPPTTARSQIQICISALRRLLAEAGVPATIETRAPGYLLRVADDDVDLHRFEPVCAQARRLRSADRPTEAVELYREALALWAGPPLAGMDSPLLQAAGVQLLERMLAVLEECIDLELRLGRHQDVVPTLLSLVAEHPLRERLRAQLMLALYRSGRQAEALAAYRQARADFAGQLGLEPGEELRRLERAILTGEVEAVPEVVLAPVHVETHIEVPAPEPPPADPAHPVPQLLPADIVDFVGRAELAGELAGLLTGPAALGEDAPVPVVAIAGPGGVGKSALMVHVAHTVRAAFPDGQLFASLGGAGGRGETAFRSLERFLRVLGVAGSALPETLAERAAVYRNILAGRRLLVVLDDAADERGVLPLLPGLGGCAVLLTSRYRLTGLPNVRQVDLDVLDAEPAVGLLSSVIGKERVAADAEAARTLVELCGGLPLAIRIGAARLAARPHWGIGQLAGRLQDERRRLDELIHRGLGVRPSIAVAYEALAGPAQVLFQRLSILETRDFAGWVAAPLLDADPIDAEDLLESLVDVRLLDAEEVGGRTRYRFHDLIRVYARERLSAEQTPAERTEALRRLLRALLSAAGAAHMLHYGGDYTIVHGGEPRLEPPPGVVADLVADPLDWLEGERTQLVSAVHQAHEAGFDELCWDLAITSVTLFEAHSYHDDWRDTHEAALMATQRTGNRRGQAAMLYSLGALHLVQHRYTEAAGRLEAALGLFREIDDRHGEALTLRHVGFVERLNGDLAAARATYETALAGLHEAGDLAGEAHVLSSLAQIRLEQHDYEPAEEMLSRALIIARASGGRRVEAQLLHRLGDVRCARGDLDGANAAYLDVLRLVRVDGDVIGEAYALLGLGNVQIARREPEQAGTLLARALPLAQRVGERMLHARICLTQGELHRLRGEIEAAAERMRQAAELFAEVGAPLWRSQALIALGEVLRVAGAPETAVDAWAEAETLLREAGNPGRKVGRPDAVE